MVAVFNTQGTNYNPQTSAVKTGAPASSSGVPANPYSSGDQYSIDNVSNSFDQAMARLAGNVFQNQGNITTQPVAPTAPTSPQLPSGVSQDEINWALQIEQKVQGGYQPTQEEVAKYQDIAKRLSEGNATQAGPTTAATTSAVQPVTQDEINWALALEQKHQGGYTPSPEETAKYQDIAHRLSTAQQGGATTANAAASGANNRDWASWSQPFQVPRNLFQTTPTIIQVPSTLREFVPTLPTYTTTNVGPSFNPAPATGGAVQGVSQQEIEWALALENKVKSGYTPNEAELYQYKGIADRLAANQGQVAPTGNQPTAPQNGTQPAANPQAKPSWGDRLKGAWNALTGK